LEQRVEGSATNDHFEQDVPGTHGELEEAAIAKTPNSHAIDEE
jgi:hypothetical protein